ncbi:helix-turn-helix domain-containing protein [Halobaculum litoreum]|uniref:Helix-turn-helix domain-containing protein n=1 Tax=Halobaculum litoreum TaxID=3031998 RepID=A0ABD5XQY3_9EURY|nr:helix-turn-helix domain-containing protein [Halobaculum sp. DT92]
MAVIAEFTVEPEQFVLGRVLARASDIEVEMERVVPSSRRVMPYIWVRSPDLDAFESDIQSSEYVEDVVPLDVLDGRGLYRVEWSEEVRSLIFAMAEFDATILEAHSAGRWFFRIRFEDRSRVAEFNDFLRTRGIDIAMTRLYTLVGDEDAEDPFGLTDTQRRSLALAIDRGYFEVPRRTTLRELAGELGVSEQSLSETVRRGVNNVLQRTVASGIDPPSLPDDVDADR